MKTTAIILAFAMALSASECSSQTEDRIERMADHFESTMEDFEDSMEVLEDMMEDFGDYFADHDVTFNCDNYSYVVKGKKGGKKITISKKDALVTFKFPVANFNAIDAGRSFQVVMCDTVDSIVVRVNEKLKNHLNVRYNSGTLVVDLDRVSSLNTNDGARCGYVYIPYNLRLSKITLNGIASFSTSLPINTTNFKTELSGASHIQIPSITAKNVELSQSGTSSCKSDIKCANLDVDLSGASEIKGTFKVNNIDLDLSGTSKVTSHITCNDIDADLSGASGVALTGKANRVEMDLSGTSSFRGEKLNTSEVSGGLSGCSSANIDCSKYIEMELSGTSHLSYSGNPKTNFSASRTSKIEHK